MIIIARAAFAAGVPTVAAAVALALALASPTIAAAGPADDIVASAAEPALRLVLDEVLARSPEILAARARAIAADQIAPQERALPDPVLMAAAFPRSPDAQFQVEYSQEYTSRSKRRLLGEAASHDAVAAWADLEATRLMAVTKAREMWFEIAYLDETARIAREEGETLTHFETIARARHASGEGLQQDAVKLQAEITRTELERIDLESERHVTVVALNAMRGRPGQMELSVPALPRALPRAPDPRAVMALASEIRPEAAAAAARLAAATTRIEVARKERVPDMMLGGAWTFMRGEAGMGGGTSGWRDDEAMVSIGFSLPIRGKKLAAMLEQATWERHMASAERDGVMQGIERDAAQIAGRIGFTLRQLALNESVLSIQTDEALRSAVAAYSKGLAGSLDLLDAERELFEVRRGAARSRADVAILSARLEGVIGAPLPSQKEKVKP